MSNLKKDPKQDHLKITDGIMAVDKDGCLINIDPLVFGGDMDGNTFGVLYKYSDHEEQPLDPDLDPRAWGDYTEDSVWMAMQEKINNVVMAWKVMRIKGVKGDKGDQGVAGRDGRDGKDGQDGQDGVQGVEGQSSFHSYVFTRWNTQPPTPIGGSYDNPIPIGGRPVSEHNAEPEMERGVIGGDSGGGGENVEIPIWYDGIPPENGRPVWMSSRILTSDGLPPQQNFWSTPVKIADTETVDYEFSNFRGTNPGNPTYPLNGAMWHNDGREDDRWMAHRTIRNGLSSLWSVVKIKGEDGVDGDEGQSSFTSFVFRRSPVESQPAKPAGGSYYSPVPPQWSDGIPSGVGAVWQSHRVFSKDGNYPQTAEWSTPILAIDNQYKDYEYSDYLQKPEDPDNNPDAWHNDPMDGDIWQAVRDINNGVYGAWTIQRIKGEAGASGIGYSVVSSNPVHSIAVGSDSIASIPESILVGLNVYRNATMLSASTTANTNANTFFIQLPTDLPSGISVSKKTASTLRFAISAGTLFNGTVQIPINVLVGAEQTPMISSFTIVPITTAEDGTVFTLQSDATAVKFDGWDNLVTPTEITFTVNQQGTDLPITWWSEPAGLVSGSGNLKVLSTVPFFQSGNDSVRIHVSIPNGMTDTVTIIKTRDGLPGSDGDDGQSSFTSFVFKRGSAQSQPATPIGGSYYSPVPPQWSDGIPSGVGAVWQSHRVFSKDGNYPQTAEWSTPVLAIDNQYKDYEYSSWFDKPEDPDNNPDAWHNDPMDGDIWQAVRDINNGIYGAWTVQRIKGESGNQGAAGPPGINGTAGPVPRTFEWVVPATYENTVRFRDYVYYRDLNGGENSTTRGWYTVIKPSDDTDAYAESNAGAPDPSKFHKEDFSSIHTFGTVIAEQANLAGFIFRNQKLYSQAKSNQNCGGTITEYNNLTIDGLQGIIKFLERMVMDKDGIALKDDCGRPRMVFQWSQATGIPILRFYDENNNITWEAGQEGYKEIVVYAHAEIFDKFNVIPISGTPSTSNIPNWYCKDSDKYVHASENMHADPPPSGVEHLYEYTPPAPDTDATQYQLSMRGKILTAGVPFSTGSAPLANGWYLTNLYVAGDNTVGSGEYVVGRFTRYENGVVAESTSVNKTINTPC